MNILRKSGSESCCFFEFYALLSINSIVNCAALRIGMNHFFRMTASQTFWNVNVQLHIYIPKGWKTDLQLHIDIPNLWNCHLQLNMIILMPWNTNMQYQPLI